MKTEPIELKMKDGRLRREVGQFRERFQALSTALQDLHSGRAPQTVLRSVRAVIANTLAADAVWILDGRGAMPVPLLRGGEPFPPLALGEVRHCLRAGRVLTLQENERTTLYLAPVSAGTSRWGALVVRIPEGRELDPEGLRFLSLIASLLGGAAGLWENRLHAGEKSGDVPEAWLRLGSLPARILFLFGESGTGKRTLAERMHDRYGSGSFASVPITGGAEDAAALQAALRRPGLGGLYVHDAALLGPDAAAQLLNTAEREGAPVIYLGSSAAMLPRYPSPIVSRGMVFTIRMPALRERAPEIASLVLKGLAERGVKARLSTAARRLLLRHVWPDNYDELERFVAHAEQALRLEAGETLSGAMVRQFLGDARWLDLPAILDGVEADVMAEALRRLDGNRAAVARVLGMTARQVGYKCEKHGLEDTAVPAARRRIRVGTDAAGEV